MRDSFCRHDEKKTHDRRTGAASVSDTELDPEVIQEITTSLALGNRIEAIKTYRQATGQGLKESKEFIDQLIPELVEKDPERFAGAAPGSGCGTAVLLLAAAVACGVAAASIAVGAASPVPMKNADAGGPRHGKKPGLIGGESLLCHGCSTQGLD